MRLRPCSACARHALLGSTSCPFCAATLACFVEPPGSYVGRVTRAAVFAGAVLAAPAAGCASGPHARYEQLPPADSDTAVPTGVVKGRVLRDDGSAASGRSVMLIGTGLRALRGSESNNVLFASEQSSSSAITMTARYASSSIGLLCHLFDGAISAVVAP